MYSSGLPILYPVGFLTFFVAYWIEKGMLMKFHRKTSTFNQNLAFDTIPFFRVAILMHLIMSGLMLSSPGILDVKNLKYLDYANVVKDANIIDEKLYSNEEND